MKWIKRWILIIKHCFEKYKDMLQGHVKNLWYAANLFENGHPFPFRTPSCYEKLL